MILPWIFGVVGCIGVVFLGVSLLLGTIAEGAEEIFENIDEVLEGLNIDIIPDSVWDFGGDVKGVGCSSIAAFMAGFGAAGLAAYWNNASALMSTLIALVSGIVVGVVYIAVMTAFYRQQGNSLIEVTDYIGLHGRATINSAAGEVGQVALTVKGEMRNYPAVEQNGAALKRDDQVEVISLSGGRLYVKIIKPTTVEQ